LFKLAAHEAEQKRLDLALLAAITLLANCDECRAGRAAREPHRVHDLLRHLLGDYARAGFEHRVQRLFCGHRQQSEAIAFTERRHQRYETLEVAQIVFAQREHHAVWRLVHPKCRRLAGLIDAPAHCYRYLVFHKIRQLR
jgi:hypothetical protein